jgi:heme/copper-type cytochrome/quinol oxidase subunit 4
MKIKNILFVTIGFILSLFLPMTSYAVEIQKQVQANPTLADIIMWANGLINGAIIPLLFSLATAAFIWGVISYYLKPDNEEKRKKGKEFITGGLIALFLILSMWGIVKIFTKTFNLDNRVPQIHGGADTSNFNNGNADYDG